MGSGASAASSSGSSAGSAWLSKATLPVSNNRFSNYAYQGTTGRSVQRLTTVRDFTYKENKWSSEEESIEEVPFGEDRAGVSSANILTGGRRAASRRYV